MAAANLDQEALIKERTFVYLTLALGEKQKWLFDEPPFESSDRELTPSTDGVRAWAKVIAIDGLDTSAGAGRAAAPDGKERSR